MHIETIYSRLHAIEKKLNGFSRDEDDNTQSDFATVNMERASDVFAVPSKTETAELREKQRQKAAVYIAALMERAYNKGELRDLCHAMGIDYESIEGETKRAKIHAIVGHFYRRRTLRVFIEFLEGDRPNEVWRIKDIGE